MDKRDSKIKILVACHKADPAIRQDDIYMPIQVGKVLHPELDLGFQGDDTGDNISEKNGSYCELTAMYWAWKNLPKDVDIVGLCHYRRYFNLDKNNPSKNIRELLQKNDVILLSDRFQEISTIDGLAQMTCIEDATLFIDLLVDLFPEWKSFIGKYFYQSCASSWCNMGIMPRRIFDEYCSFLFPFLEKLENRLLPASYTRHKRRIGYFAEKLMGFWVNVNKYKVTKIPFEDYSENSFIRYTRNLRQRLVFKMFKHTPFTVFYAAKIGLEADGITLNHLIAK